MGEGDRWGEEDPYSSVNNRKKGKKKDLFGGSVSISVKCTEKEVQISQLIMRMCLCISRYNVYIMRINNKY